MQDFESRISIPTLESVFKEFREIVGISFVWAALDVQNKHVKKKFQMKLI